MRSGPTRRGLLQGLGAGALIIGFDPVSRHWVTGSGARRPAAPVPPLTGQLLFSGPEFSAASDDFGHIVHQQRWAVPEPGGVGDIEVMRRHRGHLTPLRGAGRQRARAGGRHRGGPAPHLLPQPAAQAGRTSWRRAPTSARSRPTTSSSSATCTTSGGPSRPTRSATSTSWTGWPRRWRSCSRPASGSTRIPGGTRSRRAAPPTPSCRG